MKASFFSAMLAAFMLATASVGGITASAGEGFCRRGYSGDYCGR